MIILVLSVATNPGRHAAKHILSDDSSSNDEDPIENHIENGANLDENDLVQENH
jgi:hypothetical protein